jgi:hypothetical protein
VRYSIWDKRFGYAVVTSNAEPGEKRIYVGRQDEVEIMFVCPGTSISVRMNNVA